LLTNGGQMLTHHKNDSHFSLLHNFDRLIVWDILYIID
jgi:hypothetical protein